MTTNTEPGGRDAQDGGISFGFVLGLTLPGLLEHHGEWAAEAERAGASLLSIGEVPVLTVDPYLFLHGVATQTHDPLLGTVVSMPGLRHPVVHARAMVTLQALTGGRVFMGLGRGLGGLKLLGGRPVTMHELFDYARTVRDLCAGESVVHEGTQLQLAYEPRHVPLYIAATGPMGLRMAGRDADGVIVGNGATVDRVAQARQLVREGAEAAGRTSEDLDAWYMIRIHIAESETAGIREMEFYLSRLMLAEFATEQSVARLEPDLAGRVRSYVSQANDRVDSYGFECTENRELLDRLGLTEWGARQFFLTGPVEHVAEQLRGLVDAGARKFIVPLMLPDIVATTHEVAEVFERLRHPSRVMAG